MKLIISLVVMLSVPAPLQASQTALAAASAYDADQDGFADAVDAFPDDEYESADSDGDGVGDNFDDDDDNDGIADRMEEE